MKGLSVVIRHSSFVIGPLLVLGAWSLDLSSGAAAGDKAIPAAVKERVAIHTRATQDMVLLGEKRPVLVRLHIYYDGKPYQEVWEQYIALLFKDLDVNGDGVLNQKEAERAPTGQALQQVLQGGIFNGRGGSGGGSPSFSDLDQDPQDGKVTLTELMDYYRRSGAGPFMMSPFFNGQETQTSSLTTEALFKHLDLNKDGKLSEEELAQAAQTLHKLDLNDDELISVQELVPDLNNPFAFQVAPPQVGRTVRQEPSPVFVISRPADINRLAPQIIDRYGKKTKSKPGFFSSYLKFVPADPETEMPATHVTPADIGLDKETFNKLDVNKDGLLDGAELRQYCERPADIDIVLRLGRKKSQELTADILPPHPALPPRVGEGGGGGSGPLAKAISRNGHNLMLSLGDIQATIRGGNEATGYEEAGKAQEAAIRQFYLQQFNAADTSKKGYIEMKDVSKNRNAQFISGLFKYADRNADGKLTEKEFIAYLDLQAKAPGSFTMLSVSDQGRGLFEILDANRDGFLGPRELRSAWARLAPYDKGKKGFITKSDIPRQFQLSVAIGASPYARQFGFNPNGMAATAPGKPTKGPLWFRKMDRNGDGDVSFREFLGTREDFNRIDTDGDGLIDADEAQRADEWFRKKMAEGKR